jgi:coenzyme F420-reducing hydrogenase gamma subunit
MTYLRSADGEEEDEEEDEEVEEERESVQILVSVGQKEACAKSNSRSGEIPKWFLWDCTRGSRDSIYLFIIFHDLN